MTDVAAKDHRQQVELVVEWCTLVEEDPSSFLDVAERCV